MQLVRFQVLIYPLLISFIIGCGFQGIAPPKSIQKGRALPEIPPETDLQVTPEMVEEYSRIYQISDLKISEFYLTHPSYAEKHPYRPTAEDIEFYEREFLEKTYPGFKKLAEQKGFMQARHRYMSNPVEGSFIGSREYTGAMYKLEATGGRGASTGTMDIMLDSDPTSTAYREGMKLYGEKRLDEAIKMMEDAVRAKPDAPAILYDLGVMYMEKGNDDKAIDAFLKSIQCIKSTGYTGVNLSIYSGVYVDACTNLGLIYIRSGRYEEAVQVLKEAIQFRPGDLNANWNLGFAYWSMDDMENTAAQMKKYTELDPKNAEAHNIIGLVCYCKEFYNAALDEFRIAEKLNPGEKRYSYNEALALARLDRYAEVEQALKKASGLEEGEYLSRVYEDRIIVNRANKLYNEGCAAMEHRNLTQAIGLFNAALELKPDMVGAHVNLGVCYRTQGDMQNQIHHFEEAARLKPDMPDAHYNLGLAYSAARMYPQAIVELRQAIELKPSSRDAHFNLGTALYKTENYTDAAKAFAKCVELSPKWFEAHLNLGSCYLKTGDVDSAMDHFERATQLKPDSAEAYYNLGAAYMRVEKLDKASVMFRKALELDPAHRRARIMLREIEMYNNQ